MDRGAARHRRKEGQRERKSVVRQLNRPREDGGAAKAAASPRDLSTASNSRFKPKVVDNTDPSRFRPKAIRDAAALLWPQGEFPIPPSPDILSRVTRVDLFGSGCTDVSWLKSTKVTWLNLKGCRISNGWDAVGSLADLAVLNISETDLNHLPADLGNLHKLKALVAMGNPWVRLDSGVIEHWQQLNSLIVSHSPKLKGLPKALNTLRHLAKISFSHCPSLHTGGLPDLSDLPLLRDVKLNNLALLDKLPSHISKWGTGALPISEHTPIARNGDGLEVLDLGNCSLPFSTIQAVFLREQWPHLRSLSLHSNPLAISNPDYAEVLQDATSLPKLQIIDAKRVVDRKRKGEVQETRLERRRRLKKEKRQTTGSNARALSSKTRSWGNKAIAKDETLDGTHTSDRDADVGKLLRMANPSGVAGQTTTQPTSTGRKRKRQTAEKPYAEPSSMVHLAPAGDAHHPAIGKPSDSQKDDSKRRKRTKHRRNDEDSPVVTQSAPHKETTVADDTSQSLAHQNAKLGPEASRKSQAKAESSAAKVETIVTSAGGIDLRDVIGKTHLEGDSGSLGVGGW